MTVQLGYCTNIHPADGAEDLVHMLDGVCREVKALASPHASLGLGLRVGARAAAELRAPSTRAALREALDRAGLHVFTLNGFVLGRFHGTAVKADVYRPDWREPARQAYTRDLIDLLRELASPGTAASISTAPVGFADDVAPDEIAIAGARLVEIAVELWRVAEAGGPILTLALEPEPCCVLETIAQTVAFFAEHLHGTAEIAAFRRATGVDAAAAELALRRHLGVCLDACHAAVEFEEPRACVRALVGAGIAIAKVQVSAGLELEPSPDAVAALARFADGVYLHQVVGEQAGELVRFVDLEPAIAAARAGRAGDRWRVHFHVPVFRAEIPPFASTQPFLAELIAAVREVDATQQFEVETYTWDVLPPEHRDLGVAEAIARELAWTAGRLAR